MYKARDHRIPRAVSYLASSPATPNLVTVATDTLDVFSSNNPGYPRLLGKVRVGGNFSLYGRKYLIEPTAYLELASGTLRASGMLMANPNAIGRAVVAPYTEALPLPASGAELYSRCKPAEPNFDGLNAIFELKDLPELLRKRFTRNNLHRISDYWLALKFGWEPLLRDIRSMIFSQQRDQKKVGWLFRNNGRPVRVSATLPGSDPVNTVTFSGTGTAAFSPAVTTGLYVGTPTYTVTENTVDKTFAVGQMRFYLPEGPRDVEYTRRLIRELNGLTPRPSVIYNAIPWTWLVDWFSNIGDVIDNLDAGVADRLLADYFYVMRTKERTRKVDVQGVFKTLNGNVTATASTTTIATSKTRVAAGYFGPALSFNNLNATQLSILGALGASRY